MRTNNSVNMTTFMANWQYLTCALDGTELTSIDDRIFIEEIIEEPIFTPEVARKPTRGSLMLNSPGRDQLNIKITVYVKERDRAERVKVIRKVAAWANAGGTLTCGYRQYQEIYVKCITAPKTTVWDTRQRIEMVFTSYEGYWRDDTPETDEGTGTSLTLALTPKGDISCPLEAEITANAAVASVTLACGSNTIALTSLTLASGDVLKIQYDENGFLTIKVGTTSYLGYRSAESADDIWLTPNTENSITFTSNASCTVTVIGKGVYL